jgi:hypothetical protein
MIPVQKQPEPGNFTEIVTKKANKFLNEKPSPTGKEIHNRPYWRNALDDLYKSYSKVCAYSSVWCPRDGVTVDHFIPVSGLKYSNPKLVYDWDNFRLASRSMNTEKNRFQDVLDPFLIKPGWFVMDFPSLIIKGGAGLSSQNREKVEATIKRLKLNAREKYIEYRWEILWDYCELCSQYDDIEPILKHLERKAPFIAYELKRQDLTKQIAKVMKYS